MIVSMFKPLDCSMQVYPINNAVIQNAPDDQVVGSLPHVVIEYAQLDSGALPIKYSREHADDAVVLSPV